jgi:uncharacterized membrane protein
MTTGRLEAFSDAVLAIIITIMVLELHVPHEPTLHALAESATGLLTYLLSFVYLGIYWNNHHHLFQLVSRVRGGVLWANLHLLFWLSLVPLTTAWMDEQFAPTPVMVYGVNLMPPAYHLRSVSACHEPDSPAAGARPTSEQWISPLIYLFGIIGSLAWVWVGTRRPSGRSDLTSPIDGWSTTSSRTKRAPTCGRDFGSSQGSWR